MPDADTETSLVRSYTSPVPGVKKGLQALLGLMRVVSQFSFEALCDMISLHNERARMRERDDDDQFQRGTFSPRDHSYGGPLVCGVSAEHTSRQRTHGRTRG